MLHYIMAAIIHRQVIISDENEGPLVNIAAVRIANSGSLFSDLEKLSLSKHLEAGVSAVSDVNSRSLAKMLTVQSSSG
jgi:hypothetical protein